MKFLKDRNCWVVRPTKHTNYIHVVQWCHERWGGHRVDDPERPSRAGTWSYCDGTFYGIKRIMSHHVFDDTRLYFSFDREEDAMFFSLRWA